MSYLGLTALFLAAALIFVPLFKRIGLGSVLGYLFAGLMIGPWGLGFVSEVDAILHFAELGVVLLLFLIGLELHPARLWTMRRAVFGIGGAQVGISALGIAAVAVAVGMDWRGALVAGLALSLSSTAFALQLMAEKKMIRTRAGRTGFAILLFQDLAAIPIIALVPFLGASPSVSEGSGIDWGAGMIAIGAVIGLVVIGHFGLRPVLRLIAKTEMRELFTASALLVVIGSALLMYAAGLSMALGAFLAGVLLADSEFRPALEADIQPFKGLLLGLFFMAVGMSVNLGLFVEGPWIVIGIAVGLTALKAAVLYGVGFADKLDGLNRRNLAIALSQGGEFAFVILTIAADAYVIWPFVRDYLILSVTLSMAITPILFLVFDRMTPAPVADTAPADSVDIADDGHPVIIAGFGRFGQIVGRILRAKGIGFVALERDAGQVDFVTGFGAKVYYGDASRIELLHSAGAHKARVFVLAVTDPDESVHIAASVRQTFPRLKVIARARDREHALRLMNFGVSHVIREMFHSSLEASRQTLESLGLDRAQANEVVEIFRDHDERRLLDQRKLRGDAKAVRAQAKKWADELEALFAQDAADDAKTLSGDK